MSPLIVAVVLCAPTRAEALTTTSPAQFADTLNTQINAQLADGKKRLR